MFENIINPNGKKVEKSADAAEFHFVDGVLVRKDPMFNFESPKPSDATREPQYAPGRFNSDASIVDRKASGVPMVDPMLPGVPQYSEPSDADLTSAGTMPNFAAQMEAERQQSHGFVAPTPGRNPADGPAAVRLGNGYVLKSECGTENEETN